MAEIKKISTELQLLDKFLDTSGDAGTSGQVLSSTGTGINWVSGGSLPGGPYLPLSAGASYPLTGVLYIGGTIRNSSGDLEIRNQTATGFATATKLKQQTVNGLETFLTFDGTTRAAYFSNQGNVGIGTTSPGVKLEVASSSNPSIKIQDTTDGYAQKNSLIFDQKIVAAQTEVAKIYTELFNGATTTLNNPLKFATAQRSTLTMTDRMVIDNLGNVGIGATNPLRKLHVVGQLAVNNATTEYYGVLMSGGEGADPSVLIGDWHNSSGTIKWDSTGNYLRIDSQHSTANAAILFSGNDGSTEYMRITSAGNVGIGTTSPDAKLDVSAGTNLNLGIRQLALDNFSNEGIGITFSRTSSDADLMAIGVVSTDKLGIFSRVGIMFLTGGSNQYAQTVERMRITHDGNVGIGTASPSAKLDVAGTGNFTGLVSGITPVAAANFVTKAYVDGSGGGTGPFLPLAGGTMTGSIDFGTNNKDISMTDAAGAVTRVMVLNTSSTMYIGPVDTYAGGSILYGVAAGVSYQSFHTGASERMRIASNGSVGINNTAPSSTYKLDVGGSIRSTTTSPSFVLQETDAGNQQYSMFGLGGEFFVRDITNSTYPFKIENNVPTSTLVLDSTGKVGIGTTSPAKKLEVVSNGLDVRWYTTISGSSIRNFWNNNTTNSAKLD